MAEVDEVVEEEDDLCKDCNGTGLKDNFHRCETCGGTPSAKERKRLGVVVPGNDEVDDGPKEDVPVPSAPVEAEVSPDESQEAAEPVAVPEPKSVK